MSSIEEDPEIKSILESHDKVRPFAANPTTGFSYSRAPPPNNCAVVNWKTLCSCFM